MPERDAFPIVEIEQGWVLRREAMGSKNKFWYRPPDSEAPWLFKYPQAGAGQHWAEKVAAETADRLRIVHAVVELATIRGVRGSCTKSFTINRRQLIHGNEVLAATMSYERDKRFGQSAHTLSNIFRALEFAFRSKEAATAAKRQFAGYLVLDALVGNTDRHHENWGFVVRRTASGLKGRLAPTFDHASSLGRELRDAKREERLREGSVGRYSERARGAVYWTDAGRHGPSPLEIVRRATRAYPDLFRDPIERIRTLQIDFLDVVRRVPDDWMTGPEREFAASLMRYNAAEIVRCLP